MGVQTFTLTHNLDGSLKEPHEKDFIDFSFDGKYVSEFDMVAVFDGDRYSFNSFPDFQDEVSEINGTNGQYYWGTKIKTKKRTFKLATDGITERQINNFKKHFIPGKYGKFIEDHQAYRYSYCRIVQPPKFSLIPFKKKIQKGKLDIYDNYYKGEITLDFEWDKPYSYSLFDYIEQEETLTQSEKRAALNDNIPLWYSWKSYLPNENNSVLGEGRFGMLSLGILNGFDDINCYLGKNKSLQFDRSKGYSDFSDEIQYSYEKDYSKPMVVYNPSLINSYSKFTLNFPSFITTPIVLKGKTLQEPIYFSNIADTVNYKQADFINQYNSIEMSSSQKILENGVILIPEQDQYITSFKYTSPNIIFSINKIIQLTYNFYKNDKNGFGIKLEEKIREEIQHDKVLKWAMFALALVRGKKIYCSQGDKFLDGVISTKLVLFDNKELELNWFNYFNILMLCFFCNLDEQIFKENAIEVLLENNGWTEFFSFSLILDGEKSESSINFTYCEYSLVEGNNIIKIISSEENCGDISLTPYLKLEGGDVLNPDSQTIDTCHFLQFKNGGTLDNCPLVTLEFKNLFT